MKENLKNMMKYLRMYHLHIQSSPHPLNLVWIFLSNLSPLKDVLELFIEFANSICNIQASHSHSQCHFALQY